MGQLAVSAVNQNGGWRLDNLAINQSDSQFLGSGFWRPGGGGSKIDFTLESQNIGHLVSAMGYPKTVRGGGAKLAGELDWRGPPTAIDFPSLNGKLDLHAWNGRFEKIEPGAGRLLGILSLQALPRRISLDFRDVFSEGYAFDSITGKVDIISGTMHTNKNGVEILGPAAKIRMKGQADIAAETQNLNVNVQPTLSEGVAAAAAVANPAVGLGTYIAQKVLGDPIEKLFAYDFKITGKWADPLVEKGEKRLIGRQGVGDQVLQTVE